MDFQAPRYYFLLPVTQMNTGLVEPSIFVDDSDARIIYAGQWIASEGISTDFTALSYPQQKHTPWYGTTHTSTGVSGFQFPFEGTAVRTVVQAANASAVTSCIIDGVKQTIESVAEGQVCFNNATLQAGNHNLEMTFGHEAVSFDGLFYTPLSMPLSGVDTAYHAPNESVGLPIIIQNKTKMKMPGHRLQFDFHGSSVGLYGKLSFLYGATASLSYFVDKAQPSNFTLTSPIKSGHFVSEWQLIVQTPQVSPGPHTLQMILLNVEPSRNATSITPQLIIVQNSTHSLDAVPPISHTSSQPSPTSPPAPTDDINGSDHLNKVTLIAIIVSAAVATLIILILALCLIRRFFRRRTTIDGAMKDIISPFPFLPNTKRRLQWAQNFSRSKLNGIHHDSTERLNGAEANSLRESTTQQSRVLMYGGYSSDSEKTEVEESTD